MLHIFKKKQNNFNNLSLNSDYKKSKNPSSNKTKSNSNYSENEYKNIIYYPSSNKE